MGKSQRCNWHMIPLCMFTRCHRTRCAFHRGVNDTAVPYAAESDFGTGIKRVLRIIHEDIRQSWLHSDVIDIDVKCTPVSLTPLCNQLCRIDSRIRRYIRKGFNPCIRGSGEVIWWKKQRSKISCHSPFLRNTYSIAVRQKIPNMFFFLSDEKSTTYN
jgi:hypothetical protein